MKTRIREIADLLVVDRLRQKFGIESTRPTLHMSFTGSPGTGKTTVALRMAEMLNRMGYLAEGHLVNLMTSRMSTMKARNRRPARTAPGTALGRRPTARTTRRPAPSPLGSAGQ